MKHDGCRHYSTHVYPSPSDSSDCTYVECDMKNIDPDESTRAVDERGNPRTLQRIESESARGVCKWRLLIREDAATDVSCDLHSRTGEMRASVTTTRRTAEQKRRAEARTRQRAAKQWHLARGEWWECPRCHRRCAPTTRNGQRRRDCEDASCRGAGSRNLMAGPVARPGARLDVRSGGNESGGNEVKRNLG
jgi:hypothetical protein